MQHPFYLLLNYTDMSGERDFVLSEFFKLDDGQSGHNAILLGLWGGRASLLKYLTYLACKGKDIYGDDREKQACIWRAREHDLYLEFFKMGIGILAVPWGGDFTLVKVLDKDTKEEITVDDLEKEGIDYFIYRTSQDIVDHLTVGKVVCILFPGISGYKQEAEFYAELGDALNTRKTSYWAHLAIDKASELYSSYSMDVKVHRKFKDAASYFSSNLINCILGDEDFGQLDSKLGDIFPWTIYMRGTIKRRDIGGQSTKLKQDYITRQKENSAYITDGLLYDRLPFPEMPEEYKADFRIIIKKRTFNIEIE
ncbi:hypothetical protein Thermo_01714 [Thermoplasmatales archaeon]|nr:hypothetical protein Thermo_01714 [Thermoplasmatales archaeon]